MSHKRLTKHSTGSWRNRGGYLQVNIDLRLYIVCIKWKDKKKHYQDCDNDSRTPMATSTDVGTNSTGKITQLEQSIAELLV